ncbi:MAG TPA: hypothetical protein VLC46_02790 [Thermoanaerobaculia bacterium]|jgi:hypothetical protein|nr:hypothetical protein [Thermoanaerobaculia bacterium]
MTQMNADGGRVLSAYHLRHLRISLSARHITSSAESPSQGVALAARRLDRQRLAGGLPRRNDTDHRTGGRKSHPQMMQMTQMEDGFYLRTICVICG